MILVKLGNKEELRSNVHVHTLTLKLLNLGSLGTLFSGVCIFSLRIILTPVVLARDVGYVE